jgi:hypothetical protein
VWQLDSLGPRLLRSVAACAGCTDAGKPDGLTALLVIAFAFTNPLISLLLTRRGHAEHPASLGTPVLEHGTDPEQVPSNLSGQAQTAA